MRVLLTWLCWGDVLHCCADIWSKYCLCRFLEKFPLYPIVEQQEMKLDELAAGLGK